MHSRLKIPLLTLLLALFASGACHAAFGKLALTGNVSLYGGLSGLNSDWNFTSSDPVTGAGKALDLTRPYQFGIEADFNRMQRRTNLWPVNPSIGVYLSNVNENNFKTVATASDQFHTTKRDAKLSLVEIDLGVKSYFDEDAEWVVPFVGGGLALVSADYSFKTVGTTKKLNTGTGLYDTIATTSAKDADSGLLYGLWGSAGAVYTIKKRFNLGAEGRYLYTLNSIGSANSVSSWNLGLFAGLHF